LSKAFTYILECADGTLYVGWTTDLEGRLRAHNAGRGGRYTRGRRPVRLAYFEEYSTRREARRREAALRRLSRPMKLRLIARND
jgi:putative endonuclease